MTTLTQSDPKKTMHQNLTFFREYAKRVIVHGDDSLTSLEDVKDALVQEIWKSGKAFNLTERDVVVLLYKGVLPVCY